MATGDERLLITNWGIFMVLGFVKRERNVLWIGEYGFLWTVRGYLWVGSADLQAKGGLILNKGLEITKTTSNLREVGLSWKS